MPKLNQINALVTARKGDAEKAAGEIYSQAANAPTVRWTR